MKKDYSLKRALTGALKRHEFVVYYQPQFDALNNRLISAEALIRWERGEKELTMPGEFMFKSEFPETLISIDFYVLKEVCIFIRKRLKEAGSCIPIAVNFSSAHMGIADFTDKLCETVDYYGIDHKKIVVELTETMMSKYSDELVNFVNAISDKGFPVSIDDFGRGAHSLPLLRDISPDIIKIDNSMIAGNCETAKERAIISSVVDLAHHMGIVTIAEGVETTGQLDYLRECGCEMVQGYLFSKPIPEAEFSEMLNSKASRDMPDILSIQSKLSSRQLLMDGFNLGFPMTMMVNLTRNSYYMVNIHFAKQNRMPENGKFNIIVKQMLDNVHPEDREVCSLMFSIAPLLAAYYRDEKSVGGTFRWLDNKGNYRTVFALNTFVKNPYVEDILVVSVARFMD